MPKSAFSPQYRLFRQMLIEARQNAALTQRDLAARLGRPQSYISKYENGERRLDVVEFLEVANALSIDVPSFLQSLIEAKIDF